MQNARLSELEKLLAKSSAKPSPVKINSAVKSSGELNSLKEENRVVCDPLLPLLEIVSPSLWFQLQRTAHSACSSLVAILAHGSNGRVAGTSGWVRE